MRVHPYDSLLQEALRRSGKISDKILEHLSGCARCRARAAFLRSANWYGRVSSPLEEYGPALQSSIQTVQLRQAVLDRERWEAPTLFERLRALIPERRQLLLRNSRRFNTWGLFELLIQRGKEETFTDPRHGEELLQLALEISSHLSRSFYGRAVIEDMQARTWGYIANARRARWELQDSEEAFEEAFAHLRRGTEDPMERAVLFDLQASLRKVQRRFDEALQLLRRAISVFRRAREVHRVNGATVNASGTYFFMGNHEQAVALLYQSLEQIAPARQPRLALCAFNNLADSLGTAGRFMEAQRVLLRARPVYQRFPEPQVQSRRRWIEAKVAYGLGHPEAEALLQEARQELMSVSTPYDMDLIFRDLSSLRTNR